MAFSALSQAIGLVLLSLLSEDAATWSGAGLAAAHTLPVTLAFLACFLGIWIGDLGVFFLARFFGESLLKVRWVKRRLPEARLKQAEEWVEKRGVWVLVGCRMTPGFRVPVYVAAGLLRLSMLTFAMTTGLAAGAWVAVIFGLVLGVGPQTLALFSSLDPVVSTSILITLAASLLISILYLRQRRTRSVFYQRWIQWEFWPAWLFYPPVILHYIWLGIKYRSLSVPMLANPGIFTGGIIGESKSATLRDLQNTSPEFTAVSQLIFHPGEAYPGESQKSILARKTQEFLRLMQESNLTYPVVLKPDIGQRGDGFKIVRSVEEARLYLSSVTAPVLLQEYVTGPLELGVFYYRFPHESHGRIFAITEKVFPVVQGDGARTLRELILADDRARLVSPVYFKRWRKALDDVVPAGKTIKLVEAGNHAQGCIFHDGWPLWTEELERHIDAISLKLEGFYIGRFDIRYASQADLQTGTGFKILELNGAASEATSIYDPSNSLLSAYSTLFHQWELVFAIGAANRARGVRPEKLTTLWREYRRYQAHSATYPTSD